jgi:hypothetical protein
MVFGSHGALGVQLLPLVGTTWPLALQVTFVLPV